MEITLTPEMQAMIERRIDTGSFESPQEVVAAALQAQEAEESAHQEWVGEFREELSRRLAALDKGEFFTEEEMRSYFSKKSEEQRLRAQENAA